MEISNARTAANFQKGVRPGKKTTAAATATKLSKLALGSRPGPEPEWVLPLLLLRALVMRAPVLTLSAWRLKPGLLMLVPVLPPAQLLKPVPPLVPISGRFLSFCFSSLLSLAISLLSYLISSLGFRSFHFSPITSRLNLVPLFFIFVHLRILSNLSSSRPALKKYILLSSSSISRR